MDKLSSRGGGQAERKGRKTKENKKFSKKLKKLLKNVKKQLTKGSGLWYYRQAHDREGVASDCSQRKGSLKTE